MSRFTKALEKIQHQKDSAGGGAGGGVGTAFADPETKGDIFGSWQLDVPRQRNVTPDYRVVTHHFSESLISEQYRMLRVNLKTNLANDGAKVILVSSSIHGEGKTVTTANLALTLAEDGHTKVVVVDADLRRGRMGEYLGFGNNRPGLSNLLMNSNGLKARDVMFRNSTDNLVVIPRGEKINNPSQVVASPRFGIVLAELRNHFDYVLVDAPPIMPVADAGILGRETDGVLMIIQVGRTPKSIIAHSNLLFKQAGVKVLGYVLTNVEYQSADYKYSYGYYKNYDE